MVKLRIVAICSNLVFIAYGLTLGLVPIWLLHAILLPMNVWRLAEVLGLNDWTVVVEMVRARLNAKASERSSGFL